MDKLYFTKLKPNAIMPSKREEDGCYDVYACIDTNIWIKPGEIKLIPTGIASAFDSKYRISLRERGSTGTKCMKINAGQIDAGYRGEWFAAINNTGINPIVLTNSLDTMFVGNIIVYYTNKAIAQAALEIVPEVEVEEITQEELLNFKSERGIGKLGSSNK